MRDEERDFLIEMNELMIGAMPRPTEDYEQVEQEAWRKTQLDYKKIIEETRPQTKEDNEAIISSINVKYKAHIAKLVEERGIATTEGQSKTNQDYEQIVASLKTRYNSYEAELVTATGRRAVLLDLYMDVILGVHILFKSLLEQQKYNPGLTPLTVWHTPITAHCMSQATEKFEQISRLDDNLKLMHSCRATEIADAQHQPMRNGYAAAIAEADALWKGGDKRLHNELATLLAKKHFVSRNSLKEKLAPIARRYGRCLGVKGVRK